MAKKQPTIQELREQITAAQANLEDLNDERLTADEVTALVRTRLEQPRRPKELQATDGTAQVGGISEALRSVVRPGFTGSLASHVLTLGDLAALLGIDDVAGRVAALVEPSCGKVPAGEREAARKAAAQKLFDLEVAEAKAVSAAESAGEKVIMRGDADPAAVLEAWR